MKEIIESIKKQLPESSVRISYILQQLVDEVEFVMGYFTSEGYIPEKLEKTYQNLYDITQDMKLGYGQLNLLEEINSSRESEDESTKYENYEVDNTVEHSLLENFTHIKPYGFKFLNDELIEAKNWKALYIKACEIFFKIDENLFLSFENKTYMNGQTRSYFSKQEEEIDYPVRILDKVYINTGFGANEFRDILIKILKEYNYNVKKFKVFLRADYNPLHRPKYNIQVDDFYK